MLERSAATCSYCKPEILSLIAALRASREDLRIANEAGLVLLAGAADLTREVERLKALLNKHYGDDVGVRAFRVDSVNVIQAALVALVVSVLAFWLPLWLVLR